MTLYKNILHHPTSSVLAKALNQNSMDFDFLFWVKSNRDWTGIEVISEINIVVAKEGITFPPYQ